MIVDLVWKHETGLKMDQCLPRKLRNTATCPMSCADRGSDLDFQFSRQPLIAFKPHFVFPDQFDTHNHLKRPKKICSANQRRRLERRVSSPHTLWAQYLWVISATTDHIQAPFRVSGPIRHPPRPTKAENIPQRESETASRRLQNWEAGLLSSHSLCEHNVSQLSRQSLFASWHSSPVSCFQNKSTPLITYKGRSIPLRE
jgi:hypothetical protein